MPRPFKPEALVMGLSLIGIGVVWMLGNMGRIDTLAALRTWWPSTLVVWGVLEIVASLSRGRGEGRS